MKNSYYWTGDPEDSHFTKALYDAVYGVLESYGKVINPPKGYGQKAREMAIQAAVDYSQSKHRTKAAAYRHSGLARGVNKRVNGT